MNVLDCIKMALSRVGLSTTNAAFQTQARTYLNATIQQLVGEATWWFLHKPSTIQCTREFTLTGVTGTFSNTNTITGQTSAATATVTNFDSSTNVLTVKNESGTFAASEVVQVDGSNYGTISSMASTKIYPLQSDLANAISFRNNSQDYTMAIVSNEDLDLRDPDQSQLGEPYNVIMVGLDSSGNQQVQLYPAPDDSNTVIDYRYYAYVPDYVSDDDNISLDLKFPNVIQPALYFGVSRLYKQEKGDYEGANIEFAEYRGVVDRALRINQQSDGNRRYRMLRHDAHPAFSFLPVDGTVGTS